MNVSPGLECNLYRKSFPSVQTIVEDSTRRALAKFASKPHLVWMLLNQKHDIISSYLDSAHDLNSIPSRKRSRSPLDVMSADKWSRSTLMNYEFGWLWREDEQNIIV
jgi:hypothetical protein